MEETMKRALTVAVTAMIVVVAMSSSVVGDTDRKLGVDQSLIIEHNSFASRSLAVAVDSNAEYAGSALWGNPTDVVVEGIYAYCVLASGLAIFDISNPALPVMVSKVYLQGGSQSYGRLYKSGDYIYHTLWDSPNGLAIIDVADPLNPFVASMHPFRHVSDIHVLDTLAFALSWIQQRVQIVNVANPLAPDSLGSVILGSIYDIFAIDTLLLVGGYNTFRIYSVSDPSAPDSIGTLPMVTERGAWRIQAVGTLAYVLDVLGDFHVIDISDPAAPVRIGGYDILARGYELSVVDTLAFITTRDTQTLHVLNIKNPASPVSVGSFIDPIGIGRTVALHVVNSTAYLINDSAGLSAVDVSNATNPTLYGRRGFPKEVLNVSVVDSLAYVACGSSGLQIVNINNPTAPVQIGSYQTAPARAVQAVGALAYVATDSGLTILSATDPTNPDSLGGLSLASPLRGVFVVDSLAYVAASVAGLYIVNVSDPTNPTVIAQWDSTISQNALEVVVVDSLAYLADESGLIILNVADAANPLWLGFLPTWQEEYSLSLAVQDTIVYLGLDGVGFWVVNVADPTSPDTLAWYDNGDKTDGVFLQDSLLYITRWDADMEIVNISNPASPVQFGYHQTPGLAVGLFVRDSIVYVADTYSLLLLKTPLDFTVGVDDETEFSLLPYEYEISQNYPNPFNPSTTIEYYLPRRTHVTVTVYNLLGRRIATLVDDAQPRGQQTVTWNGQDSQGNAVATGVYFYRLKTDAFTESRKMLLLK